MLVLAPKLDRIHLLRDAYGDVLYTPPRSEARAPAPPARQWDLPRTAGECLSRFLLQLDELERRSSAELALEEKLIHVHSTRRHVLPGCPHAWPRPQETAARKNLWFLPQTCGSDR